MARDGDWGKCRPARGRPPCPFGVAWSLGASGSQIQQRLRRPALTALDATPETSEVTALLGLHVRHAENHPCGGRAKRKAAAGAGAWDSRSRSRFFVRSTTSLAPRAAPLERSEEHTS